MLIKYTGYTLLIIMAILLTFFGVGPILFADGSLKERLITLVIVLLLYLILGIGFYYWGRIFKSKK